MRTLMRSLWAWSAALALILLWLPLLTLVFLTDRHSARRRTGRCLRWLGMLQSRVNRPQELDVLGLELCQPGGQYLVVANHQSYADIPLLTLLPLELKWLAKRSLFRAPVVGWMMRMAGDIPVDRGRPMSGALALRRALRALERGCSVIVFPEGTRSRDGALLPFRDGAFYLAVKRQLPILPVVIDGSGACLARGTWKLATNAEVRVQLLPPVGTRGLTLADVPRLRDEVRAAMDACLAELDSTRSAAAADRRRATVAFPRAALAAEPLWLPGFSESLPEQA